MLQKARVSLRKSCLGLGGQELFIELCVFAPTSVRAGFSVRAGDTEVRTGDPQEDRAVYRVALGSALYFLTQC